MIQDCIEKSGVTLANRFVDAKSMERSSEQQYPGASTAS